MSRRQITATDAGSEQSTTCKMDIYLAVRGVIHSSDAERNGSVIFFGWKKSINPSHT
jgi:hypothetical protein